MSPTISMTQVREIHRRAMDWCDRALSARREGDEEEAIILFRNAFEAEREAASLVAPDVQLEPTRSILHRSAATLALDCSEFREAERLAAVALSGQPPEEIAEELRDVLDRVPRNGPTVRGAIENDEVIRSIER